MTQRLTEDELLERIQSARGSVEVGAIYEHYKGGRYKVMDLVIQTVDDGVCVIYTAQYGKNVTFARPLIEWLEDVEVDGKRVSRFSKISYFS